MQKVYSCPDYVKEFDSKYSNFRSEGQVRPSLNM